MLFDANQVPRKTEPLFAYPLRHLARRRSSVAENCYAIHRLCMASHFLLSNAAAFPFIRCRSDPQLITSNPGVAHALQFAANLSRRLSGLSKSAAVLIRRISAPSYASAVPIQAVPSSSSAGSVRVHAFPPQPWSNHRWSSPRRCRTPRCDAIPQPIFPRRRSSAASPFASLPCRFFDSPCCSQQFLRVSWIGLALPFPCPTCHCTSSAVRIGAFPFCASAVRLCAKLRHLSSTLISSPRSHRRGGEDHASRSSSSSQVNRPFPLFRHCPKPRSFP